MNSRPFQCMRAKMACISVKPGKDVSKVEIIGCQTPGIEVEGNLIDEIIDQRRGEIVKISDDCHLAQAKLLSKLTFRKMVLRL